MRYRDSTLQHVLARVLRWKPHNRLQVWLSAGATGLIFLIMFSVARMPLLGLIPAGVLAIASGAVGTYRLGRREDARTVAEWQNTRPRLRSRIDKSGPDAT